MGDRVGETLLSPASAPASRVRRQNGYVLVTALAFFLAGSAAVIAGMSSAVVREMRTVRNESVSKQSYFASESALEDALYRIKRGKSIGSSETLSVGSSAASSTVTVEADGSQKVVSSGDWLGTIRSVEASLNTTQGISFPYVLHGGIGGLDLNNGTVTGDIYTTGSIRGCGFCTITGAAVAAGKSSTNVDQENASPSTPTNNITFGNANGTQDLAQSFTVSDSLSLTGLQVYVRKNGNPANATVRVVQDNGGNPSGAILASGTLSSSLVSTSYDWEPITLTANPVLTEGNTYWIVIDANTSSTNYYLAGGNTSTYADGVTKTGRYNNSSWNATSPANLDMYFRISIGSNEDGITGEDEWNRLTVGSAYAYKASYVNSNGALYCQIGVTNNKSCDTSRGDPTVETDPISAATIAAWKSVAESGGIEGDSVSVGWAGATLGPKKIEGNLSVGGGGTLVVSGFLWVTGSVTINGGAIVSPAGTGESYAIIADGTINLAGGGEITGTEDGHILLLSTSALDPAITINGGANDTVLAAPYGGILITGGATAKAATARHITTDGGANLIYDPSVAELNLTSGSTGEDFGIKTWKEVQ